MALTKEEKLVLEGCLHVVSGVTEATIGSVIQQKADDGNIGCQFLETMLTTKSPAYCEGERRSHELVTSPLVQMGQGLLSVLNRACR